MVSHWGARQTDEPFAWQVNDGSDATGVWPISGFTRPVVDPAGTLYVSRTSAPVVLALSADGSRWWPQPLDLGTEGVGQVALDFIDSAGRLYVRGDRRLFAIDSVTQEVLWSFEADETLHVPSVLDAHGHLVLVDMSGKLYVLDTNLEYAGSDWPIAEHGNRRHTGKQGDILELP